MCCSRCRAIPITACSAAATATRWSPAPGSRSRPTSAIPPTSCCGSRAPRRDRLGLAVGQGPPRLAHRMLGDDRARISARRSTSTAAGSTSSSRTTRMRSRRAAARTAVRRSRATGCTTASSTWAPRRCRRASAISSRRRSCWRRAIAARRCGWRCCSAHYRQPLPWTESWSQQSKSDPRPTVSNGREMLKRAIRAISTSWWSRLYQTTSTRRWRC